MCQSLRAQLSKLWQSHMNSALSSSFYLHFSLSFLSCITHFDCPPPKQISAERGKSKPRPRKFSTQCRSVKLAWQYSLWGEGGSRSVASHSVRWTCTGGRAGERERKREQSAVKPQLREREGWRRAGTYRKTQEKKLKHRGERGWSWTVGEKWGGSGGREHVMRIKDTWEDAVLLKVRHTNGRVFLLLFSHVTVN